MRKIPTLFVRDEAEIRFVTRAVNTGCEWVLAGEGVATRKWDGTCVMLDEAGAWWARREVKPDKTPPAGYRLVQTDEATGKSVGWEPLEQSSFVKFHAEALGNSGAVRPGTYELLGPKINRNPDGFIEHVLMPHGWAPLSVRQDVEQAPRDFDELRAWLWARSIEGIVWHRNPGAPDTAMVKIKKKDFRLVSEGDGAASAP